jgi:heat shock protein HslJ
VASSDTFNVITASFDASGQVSGFDGCNDYSAGYEVDQDLISIGPLATTMMACADADTSSLAAAYAIALQGATRWQVTAGGSLELQGPDGNLLVAYGPATATKG